MTMTDQTESEYAQLLRNIDFAAAEFDGCPAIYEDAASAIRALEAKVRRLEYVNDEVFTEIAKRGEERDRLAGEVERLTNELGADRARIERLADLNERLTAELATAREDVERFDWFFGSEDKIPFMGPYMRGLHEQWSPDQWRAAIDAARRAGGQ